MNSAIVAALIAAGSTSLVAIVSFFTTRSSTRRTIQAGIENTIHALDAARQDRVWQQQAAAYVDCITAVQWQQGRRQRQLISLSEHVLVVPANPSTAEKPPVDWAELEPRLFAFASPAVLKALQAANDAGIAARDLFRAWEGREQQRRQERARADPWIDPEPGPPPSGGIAAASHALNVAQAAARREAEQALEAEKAAVKKAVQEANYKDDALIDAIRADLHGHEGRALRLLQSRPPDAEG